MILITLTLTAVQARPALASDSSQELQRARGRLQGIVRSVRLLDRSIAVDRRSLRSLRIRAANMRTSQGLVQTRTIFQFGRRVIEVRRRLEHETNRVKTLRQASRRTNRQIEGLREEVIRLSRLFQYCPVDHPHWYHDDFGVISMREGRHIHQGIDVHAPMGTAIRAPFPGQAVVATNSAGGLAVKVYGAPGFVYNAHLSAFGRLGSVAAGTVIGYVGNTGDARLTQPHDHFEWHPAGGPAVDSFFYLNQAC
jgi:murein DD-endopeptidase MepM/ murein hydrolase activator NlpD